MSIEIRPAQESDATGILDIYTPIVELTAISFELAPPSEDEVRKRICRIQSTHAWLVCEEDGLVAGYAISVIQTGEYEGNIREMCFGVLHNSKPHNFPED